MTDSLLINLHIDHSQQGTYFTVPFYVPEGIEAIHLTYQYERRSSVKQILDDGKYLKKVKTNTIDLGLISPDGTQVGASGSDKQEIEISEVEATPGYTPCPILQGEWQIIAGAYLVDANGVDVRYEIILDHKSLHLLKGDLHVHSISSDGVHTSTELAQKAKANGLDFLAITDHNQLPLQEALPHVPGITMIPGVEWTHYQGHANFLGIRQPYDGPFFTNTNKDAVSRFSSATERGALVIVNHPFEGNSSFLFDLNSIPFDCLEVWNGPMRESNLRAIGLWQQMLKSGKRVPICGGSDYHHDTPFIFLGGPTTCVYAIGHGKSDILSALRQGHCYITFAPDGPTLELNAGEGMMGDEVDWKSSSEMDLKIEGLIAGDQVRVVTAEDTQDIFNADADGELQMRYFMKNPGFAWVEVLRAFLPGLPMLPALLSNPIYFKA